MNDNDLMYGALRTLAEDGDPQDRKFLQGVSDTNAANAQYRKERGNVPRTPQRDRYSLATTDAFYDPVISTRAVAEQLAGNNAAPEAVARWEEGLRTHYPNGLMSMQQTMREMQLIASVKDAKARGEFRTPEQKARVISAIDATRADNSLPDEELAVMKVLAGDDRNTDTPHAKMATQLRGLVDRHAPGGRYAEYGGRTQAEDSALHAKMGDNAYHNVTPQTRQNLEAQRVSELFSAGNEFNAMTGNLGYMPDSQFAQVMRGVGGTFGPYVDAVRSLTTEPGAFRLDRLGEAHEDMAKMAQPDGKYGFAADVWERGQRERGTPQDLNVFDADGRAKFLTHDPTTPQGLASATSQNTSFPVARGYANLAPIREAATNLGWKMGGGNTSAEGIRQMRHMGNATQQVTPEGMSPEEASMNFSKLDNADRAMDGWISASHGPGFADAYNSTIGSLTGDKMPRSYASPFFTSILETPGEMLGDPTNLAMNLATGPIGGAVMGAAGAGARMVPTSLARPMFTEMAVGAGKGALRGAGRMAVRYGDDIVEEAGAENAMINGPMHGFASFFSPERDNLMMGTKDPNDKDYDSKFQQATGDALQARQDVSNAYEEARKRTRGVLTPGAAPQYGGRHPL